jgi:exodeoxyribonuclease VII large subunit
LRALARALPVGEALLAIPRQKLDRASDRLRAALLAGLGSKKLGLSEASRLLARHAPQAEISRAAGRLNTLAFRLGAARGGLIDKRRERLGHLLARFETAAAARFVLLRNELRGREERRLALAARFSAGMQAFLARRRERLDHAEKMLGALGYEAVLQRGFVLVRDESGLVRRAAGVEPGTALRLQFADGELAATTGEMAAAPPRKRASIPKKPTPGGQGSLF